MNARRVITAFLVALLCSGLLTWILGRQLSRPAPVTAAAPARRVVVVSKNMPAGQPLESATVETMNWPATSSLPGSFDNPQQVAGRVLLFPMSTGEPVLVQDLAAPGAGSGLVAKIPDGMRAISVRADDVDSVSGFVTPGSFVDVLSMVRADTAAALTGRTVLEKKRVLAVGQTIEPDPDSKPSPAGTVTLLVTPQEAARLAEASSLGRVSLMLRNGSDQTTSGVAALPLQAAEPSQRPARVSIATGARPMALAAAAGYTVETIAGGKKSMQTFEGNTQ